LKYLKAFALFWWDFIVGDSLTLAWGVLLTLALAALLANFGNSVVAEIVVPAAIIATLGLSLRR
jgi:hypothetical protein